MIVTYEIFKNQSSLSLKESKLFKLLYVLEFEELEIKIYFFSLSVTVIFYNLE